MTTELSYRNEGANVYAQDGTLVCIAVDPLDAEVLAGLLRWKVDIHPEPTPEPEPWPTAPLIVADWTSGGVEGGRMGGHRMSAADRLNEIEARANAATRGPWHVAPELCGPDGQGVYTEDFGPVCEVGDPYPRGDNNPQESMYFIAHARTDVPALVAALRAVLDLADYWATQGTDYDEDTEQQIDDGKAILRAITEALG